MSSAKKRSVSTAIVKSDERIVTTFASGDRIVQLMTRSALRRELSSMQRERDLYQNQPPSDEYSYFSLRTAQGERLATIEVHDMNHSFAVAIDPSRLGLPRLNSVVSYVSCKQGVPPFNTYADRLLPFFEERQYHVADQLNSLGRALLKGGDWCAYDALPDAATVDTSLNLKYFDLALLPNNMTVNGSVVLWNHNRGSLPENLTIEDSLFAYGSDMRRLPKGLVVRNNLILAGSQIMELPDHFSIGGRLRLDGAPIVRLPVGLRVGFLDISRTNIRELPEDIDIRRVLRMDKSQITSLPSTVRDDLEIIHDDQLMMASDFRQIMANGVST